MNINGAGNATNVNDVNALGQVGTNNASRPSSVPPAAGPAYNANISKPGELFAKLKELEQKDPEQFKQIVSGIADSLRSAAKQAGDSGSSFLNKLADKFDDAAKSGDLSPLQPKQESESVGSHPHHHHGHHGGGGAIASIFESALTQVNDALGASTSGSASDPTSSTSTSGTAASTP
jgi:hypothetical protein